jgi:hypothetical protein
VSHARIERWHKSLECIRPGTPASLVRLNNTIGCIAPKDMLAGRQQEIHAERDRKLEAARQ